MRKIALIYFILLYTALYSIDLGYNFTIEEPVFKRFIFIPVKSLLIKESKDFKIVKDRNEYMTDIGITTTITITNIYTPNLTRYYLMLYGKKEKEENTILNISKEPMQVYPRDKKIKIRFIFDAVIDNVQDDVESYAEIYLDKKNIGITEQKLLSQEKNFEFETTYEKHLLQIVIFIQDPLKKRWIRLKNIDQPKSIYFIPNASYENLYIRLTYFPNRTDNKYNFSGSFLIDKR